MPVDKDMPILVVDDHKDMAAIAKYALRQLGFRNVDEARDGSKALNMIENRQYKLIISDINMEPMSGITLLKILRRDDAMKGITFVMMTGEATPDAVMQAKELKVDQFIGKPFTVQTLKEKLERVYGPI